MRETSFSTDTLPESQRIDYWHGVVCATFAFLELRTAARVGFSAALHARRCGDVDVVRVSGSGQQVTRSPRMISRDASENLIAMVQARGCADVEQDGRQARMFPGECAVLDSRRPYRIGLSEGFEQIVLKIPMAPMQRPRLAIAALTSRAFPLDDTAARVLRTLLETLLTQEDATTAALGPVTIDLLCLALRARSGSEGVLPRPDARYERARRAVQRHLGSPDFDVQRLADEQGISLRQLQKVFARFGQCPGDFLEAQRLGAARSILRDPDRVHDSITRVALACGFADPGYFGKRYRRRYGRSPTDERRSP